MAKSSGELTGLEWEAEKAYIVATSPRNTSGTATSSGKNDSGDDFSFEVIEVQESSNGNHEQAKEKLLEPVITEQDGAQQLFTSVEDPPDHDDLQQPPSETSSAIRTDLVEDSETTQSTIVTMTSLEPESSSQTQLEQQQRRDSDPSPNQSKYRRISLSTGPAIQKVVDSARQSIMQSDSRILVVYGPSGFGKGVLVQKMVYRSPQQFSRTISHTTRPQRLNEMYARDFYFISKPDMIMKIKEDAFMEYVQIDHAVPDIHANRDYSRQQNTPRASIMSLSSTTGDLFGTMWDSFQEALLSNKPCIVLNISTKGAEQINALGINATYILLHPGKSSEGYGTIVPNYSISINDKEEAFRLLEEYALGIAKRGAGCVPSPVREIDRTIEEWDRVPNILLDGNKKPMKRRLSHKSTSFCELLNHYQNSPVATEQMTKIKPESNPSKIFGPPKLSKRLRQERDLIFAIALCKFDDTNTLHTRSLATIYRRLIGGGVGTTCTRFGTHWEEIGFQGSDPTDDLRGVGMLGIVQLVWLLETSLVQLIAMDVFQYSRQHNREIPFCVLILNITSIAMQALREGCLSRECNRRDQVFAVFNDFTASILLSFYHTWQRQKRSPMDVGMVLQQVGAFAKKHPRFFIMELKNYMKKIDKKEIQPPLLTRTDEDTPIKERVEFTKLESKEPLAI